MSILTENSRKMLVESMRKCLSDVLHESTSLTSKQATEKIKFVTESATYEQLLNITMNPHRQEKYLPAYVLEGAVAILHSACMTGRKNIGVNAITEGALKLQKKTGAVITESMLDAALTAVREGCGLKVVGTILSEASGFDINRSWDWLLNQLPTGAEKAEIAAEVAAIKAGHQTGLTTRAKSILASNGLGNANQIERMFANGGNPQLLRLNRVKDTLLRDINAIKANPAATAADAIRLQGLERRLTTLNKSIEGFTNGTIGGAGSNALKNVANSQIGKTPWMKIALGAAALGGGGALAYKYWKNKKAMQQDMANGRSPY